LGNIATIYDWKETELYGEGGISVKEFRKLPSYSWHIGTKNGGYFNMPMILGQNANRNIDTIVNDLTTFIYLNS